MNKKNSSSGNLEEWIPELVYIAVINDLRSLTVFPGKKEKRCSKFGWFLWKPHQRIRMKVKAAIFVITDLGFRKPTYREKVTMSLDCNHFFSDLDINAQIDIRCFIQRQRICYQIMHWSTPTNSAVWQYLTQAHNHIIPAVTAMDSLACSRRSASRARR